MQSESINDTEEVRQRDQKLSGRSSLTTITSDTVEKGISICHKDGNNQIEQKEHYILCSPFTGKEEERQRDLMLSLLSSSRVGQYCFLSLFVFVSVFTDLCQCMSVAFLFFFSQGTVIGSQLQTNKVTHTASFNQSLSLFLVSCCRVLDTKKVLLSPKCHLCIMFLVTDSVCNVFQYVFGCLFCVFLCPFSLSHTVNDTRQWSKVYITVQTEICC